MPVFSIPIPNSTPSSSVSVELNGNRFIFRFFFLRRTDSWYIHLDSSAGIRLISGLRATSYYAFFNDASNPNLPLGVCYIADTESGSPAPPKEGELGTSHQLIFINMQDILPVLEELYAKIV